MSSNMRIVTGFDMMSHHYQVRIEIGTYHYTFTEGDACNGCIPYQGVKMEGEQVDNFVRWINKIFNDHLSDEKKQG